MRLRSTFGVTALIATIVLTCSFILLGMGIVLGKVDFKDIIPMVSAWVSGILSAMVVIKANANSKEK